MGRHGSDSASLLLNGLSCGFFLEMDDLLVTMLLSDRKTDKAVTELTSIVTKAAQENNFSRSTSRAAPLIGGVLAAWYFIAFAIAWAQPHM